VEKYCFLYQVKISQTNDETNPISNHDKKFLKKFEIMNDLSKILSLRQGCLEQIAHKKQLLSSFDPDERAKA